ncbi:unnamed protein product [Leuciscus chuanchicus]
MIVMTHRILLSVQALYSSARLQDRDTSVESLNRIVNCSRICDASASVQKEGVLDFLDPTHLQETLRMTTVPEGASFIQHPLGETERFELTRTED